MMEFSAEKLPAFIVVFREFLEVAIVLGVVIAATRGLKNRNRFIWAGIGAGVLGSLLVAYFAEAISNAAEGMGQELFNAGVLLTASAVIGWTVIWMRTHARQMTAHIKQVGSQITEGTLPAYTIIVIVGLAVLREGSEIVLFTYGMLASGQALFNVAAGSVLGAVAGSIFGLALYLGIVTIPVRYVFQVTTWLLILLSAGMASLAAKYLVAGGAIDWLTNKLWDTSWLLSESSIMGQILHALVGYSDQPMAIQIVFFAATLAMLASIMRLMDAKKKA